MHAVFDYLVVCALHHEMPFVGQSDRLGIRPLSKSKQLGASRNWSSTRSREVSLNSLLTTSMLFAMYCYRPWFRENID